MPHRVGSLHPLLPSPIASGLGSLVSTISTRQASLCGTDRTLALGSGVAAPTFLLTQAVVLSAAMAGLADVRLPLCPTAPPGSSPTYDGWAATRLPTLP